MTDNKKQIIKHLKMFQKLTLYFMVLLELSSIFICIFSHGKGREKLLKNHIGIQVQDS